jgi:hypothetical protein
MARVSRGVVTDRSSRAPGFADDVSARPGGNRRCGRARGARRSDETGAFLQRLRLSDVENFVGGGAEVGFEAAAQDRSGSEAMAKARAIFRLLNTIPSKPVGARP